MKRSHGFQRSAMVRPRTDTLRSAAARQVIIMCRWRLHDGLVAALWCQSPRAVFRPTAVSVEDRQAVCALWRTTVRPQAKQWYDGPDALAFLSVQPNRLEPLVRAQRVLAPPPASRRPYRP